MHKDLRNDPEISAKLLEMEKAARVYMAFDMQKLQSDMNKDLENQIQ
jgi:hypothetical protein